MIKPVLPICIHQKQENDHVRLTVFVDITYDAGDIRPALALIEAVSAVSKAICDHRNWKFTGTHCICSDCGQILESSQCKHRAWAWTQDIHGGIQRYCRQCGHLLPQDPKLEQNHRPFNPCDDPECPQCKSES